MRAKSSGAENKYSRTSPTPSLRWENNSHACTRLRLYRHACYLSCMPLTPKERSARARLAATTRWRLTTRADRADAASHAARARWKALSAQQRRQAALAGWQTRRAKIEEKLDPASA